MTGLWKRYCRPDMDRLVGLLMRAAGMENKGISDLTELGLKSMIPPFPFAAKAFPDANVMGALRPRADYSVEISTAANTF